MVGYGAVQSAPADHRRRRRRRPRDDARVRGKEIPLSAGPAAIERLTTELDVLATEVGRYGPRSVPTQLRRDHLLTSATLEFTTRGFEGTSMHQIAERAGVTKPVLYSLFGSKDELFAAVIDRASDEMASSLGEATEPDGPSRLGPGVRAYLEYAREHETLWGPMFASTHQGAVADAVRRLQRRQVELVGESLRRGHVAAGVEVDDLEIDALASLVTGAVHAVGRWWGDHPTVPIDEVVAFVETGLGATLTALRADPGRAPWFRGHGSPRP